MTTLTDQTADAARFLAHYVKAYGAGAFASPTAKELDPADLFETWRDGERVVGVVKTLNGPSRRADFTGREMLMPPGSRVVTHLAATPRGLIPDLSEVDYVVAYAEDRNVTAQLQQQGRTVHGVQVTAASEILNVWALPGNRHRYAYEDVATVVPVTLPGLSRPVISRIVEQLRQADPRFADDFPYYSDGSWSSVSIRGYSDDYKVGVKPSEMPRAWKAANPEMLAARIRWTRLAGRTGAVRALIESVPWWERTERVRILQMGGRSSPKPSVLARHSDISDRAAGLADGQIARFHIPIFTHPDIVMHTWGLDGVKRTEHLALGKAYYLDARKPHSVVNPTTTSRLHLVVDVVSSAKVRGHIADAEVLRQAAAVVR